MRSVESGLLAVLLVLGGCGGGESDSATTTEPPAPTLPVASAQVDLDTTSARLLVINRTDGSIVTVFGDRDSTGNPARIRGFTVAKGASPSPEDKFVKYDEAGRLIRASSEELGTLSVEYFTSGVQRYTWMDAATGEEYEVVLDVATVAPATSVRPQAAAALKRQAAAAPLPRPETGEIRVTCNRNGILSPMPSMLVTVTTARGNGVHYNWASGLTDSTGVFKYRWPEFSGMQVNRDGQKTLLQGLMEAKCKGSDLEAAARKTALDQLMDKVEEAAGRPSRGKVIEAIIEIGLTVSNFCDITAQELAKFTVNQFLTTVDDGLSQVELSAQARTATAFSPKVRWSIVKSAVSVPTQTLEMPEAACPARQLEGTWTGSALQPDNPLIQSFGYSMVLTQAGTTLTGTSRVTAQSVYFGDINVSGDVLNNIVGIRDGAITAQLPMPNTRWCIKNTVYQYRNVNGADTLTGSFTGPGCAPGSISVSRN